MVFGISPAVACDEASIENNGTQSNDSIDYSLESTTFPHVVRGTEIPMKNTDCRRSGYEKPSFLSIKCSPVRASLLRRGLGRVHTLQGSDKHQFSPNVINTQSREEVMRIDKIITKGKILRSFFKLSQSRRKSNFTELPFSFSNSPIQ